MKPTTALVVAGVVLGGAGTLFLYWAWSLSAQGRYPSALVVAGFAVFAWGLLAVRVIVASGRVEPRVDTTGGATVVRPDSTVDGFSVLALVAVFGAMLFYALGAPWGLVTLPGVGDDQKWFVVASVIGVLLGVPSLWRIAAQRGVGYLRLTGTGFELADAYFRAARTWEEVTEVSATSRHTNAFQISGATYVTTADGRTRTLSSETYTPRGEALRNLLQFYWTHPEHRDELADGRAAGRLRELLK